MATVLAVTSLYPPSSRVGSWLSTHELLAHLAARGHDVTVVRQRGATSPGEYTLDGVHVQTGAFHIEPAVKAADVVISHAASSRAAKAAVAARVPSIRLAHGPLGDDLDGSALVVFNSQSFLDASGWTGPSMVIHPPVHASAYRTTPGDRVTLVNLTNDKGVRTFWRAAEQLPDIGFLAVKGGYGHQVTPRARNVETIDTVRDMRQVYRRTHILLMPSAYETWGRVGVEAMASGIPVIAHPTPGLQESLGDAGIFVDRGDTAGWVRAITRLQRPSVWAEASKLARRRSADLDPAHDLENFARAVEALAVRRAA